MRVSSLYVLAIILQTPYLVSWTLNYEEIFVIGIDHDKIFKRLLEEDPTKKKVKNTVNVACLDAGKAESVNYNHHQIFGEGKEHSLPVFRKKKKTTVQSLQQSSSAAIIFGLNLQE